MDPIENIDVLGRVAMETTYTRLLTALLTLLAVAKVEFDQEGSMAGSLDVICETIKEIKDGLDNVHLHKMDKSDDDTVLITAYTALKSIPDLSRGVFVRVYDTFVVQRERAKGFLLMNEYERVEWIAITFGGL